MHSNLGGDAIFSDTIDDRICLSWYGTCTVYGPRQGLISLALGPSASLYRRWISSCSPGLELGKGRVSLTTAYLSVRSFKMTAGQLPCKLQAFDSLFGIVELCLRCGGGRNSEDEIDRRYSCASKREENEEFPGAFLSKLYCELAGREVTALPDDRKISCYA